jgi:hypothetical protein
MKHEGNIMNWYWNEDRYINLDNITQIWIKRCGQAFQVRGDITADEFILFKEFKTFKEAEKLMHDIVSVKCNP